jgi:hypothetical protein
MRTSVIVFHFVLPQDVTVLRPLVLLAKSLPGKQVELLVSIYLGDERSRGELDKLSAELNLAKTYYVSHHDARRHLKRKSGIVVGNECSVPALHWTHDLFKALPSSFLKVTTQHGFECVGFLHNAAHDAAYGRDIRFAGDVVVGWFAPERLTSLHPTERTKLYVAGPPNLIASRSAPMPTEDRDAARGMVCENLHSVRFSSPAVYESFLEQFSAFAQRLDATGMGIDFRSHPAGRFTEHMGLRLPSGVKRNSAPLYEQDLSSFDFAISPPSSIVFDFVVANIPAAVWVDAAGRMDFRNFAGLETVSSVEQWWAFASRASRERDVILASQERFLERLRIPTDVAGRYAELMSRAA